MKKTILSLTSFAVCILISVFSLYGQAGGSIKGSIINSANGEPVPLVNIYVKHGDNLIGTTSDFDGNFTLKPIPNGEYVLTFSLVGWGTKEIVGVKVYQEKITFVNDVQLTAGIIMKDVEIYADKLIDPEETSLKIMEAKYIEKLPEKRNINAILAIMSSDIQFSEERDEIYFRGSRSGDAVYYIDGIKMINSKAMCPSSAIGSVMVYSGGVPAKYGDFSGGVVVIETMSYFEWVAKQESKRLRNGGN